MKRRGQPDERSPPTGQLAIEHALLAIGQRQPRLGRRDPGFGLLHARRQRRRLGPGLFRRFARARRALFQPLAPRPRVTLLLTRGVERLARLFHRFEADRGLRDRRQTQQACQGQSGDDGEAAVHGRVSALSSTAMIGVAGNYGRCAI
ncbi:hypothetical protein [Erythrobacter aureus]|uniref:Uncharacterized protein n=1 Tax=Erythrobacter aureus TaxID=2182384 RepID=A0A345YBW9_9SPHN|nr:hypothetical protein [Erythrobacter aureus]AXK41421.1 hypothetical protein DVR09_02930 [Erythrobacter aureus]